MPRYANRVKDFGTTIFSEMNTLAQQYNAVNLGQGRPDFDTPPDILDELVHAAKTAHNQYAPGVGTTALRTAVAEHAQRFYQLPVDPNAGVVVTAGATEALLSAILGLTDSGDEVITFEPFYDAYVPGILMAQATPVCVPLHPPTWSFDPDELRAAFTEKTRALILNTPQNPTGRVFTREELTLIAELCIEHDVVVISDEVYEHLTFAPARHLPIATLPGMFERTVTISSAGKVFNTTGWKIGWAYGAPELVEGILRAHQFVTFSVHHPSQLSVAYALGLPNTYFETLLAQYETRRQLILSVLESNGLRCFSPSGTYFVLADYSALFKGTPYEFAHYLTREIGVACIPLDSLYLPEHKSVAGSYARFSFCKTEESLREAGGRLEKLKQRAG